MAVRAIQLVESSGFYKTELGPIIRVELHILLSMLSNEQKQVFDQYFDIDKDGTHKVIQEDSGQFVGFHNISQKEEYVVLGIASSLFGYDTVLSATSMGAYQIMGFHYRRLGYQSATEMFNDMQTKERQDKIFEKFIAGDSILINSIIGKDWLMFARHYNGDTPNAARYAEKISYQYNRLLGEGNGKRN